MKRTVVLGGWAFSPRVLEPVFGPGAQYIDVNSLIPSLINDEQVLPDWPAIASEKIREHSGNEIGLLAGWSTGAIIACACLQSLKPTKTFLFAATASFCRSPDFPQNWDPIALRSMKRALRRKPGQVTENFVQQCDTSHELSFSSCTVQELGAGLSFLATAHVPLQKNSSTYFFHGRDDRIVPMQAGKKTSELTAGHWIELSGGHVFFLDHLEEIGAYMDR